MDLISTENWKWEEKLISAETSDLASIWLQYLFANSDADYKFQLFLFCRATNANPYSFKLWKLYLNLILQMQRAGIELEVGVKVFENAITKLSHLPGIWSMYFEYLQLHEDAHPTFIRGVFNRALRSLTPTLHASKIWPKFLEWARDIGGPTARLTFNRFNLLDKSQLLDSARLMSDNDFVDDSIRYYSLYLASSIDRNKLEDIWLEMCELISLNSDKINLYDTESLFLRAIDNNKAKAAELWVLFAQMYISENKYHMARDVFEKALSQCTSMAMFSTIYDAYSEFEEQVISYYLESLSSDDANSKIVASTVNMDLELTRYECLMERRPFLVSDLRLRQNPNLITEWQNKIKLYGEKSKSPSKHTGDIKQIYTEALTRIDPKNAIGNLSDLWIGLAQTHYDNKDIMEGRSVFEKAVNVPFKQLSDLENVYCSWAEIEIGLKNLDIAEKILEKAVKPILIACSKSKQELNALLTALNSRQKGKEIESSSPNSLEKIVLSRKIWAFLLDLKEGLKNSDETIALYDLVIGIKIATPQTFVNYASFLMENNKISESFQVFERAVSTFSFPVSFELWNIYLTKYVEIYKGEKLEVTRDLFEQALEGSPNDMSKPLFLFYADFEEKYGFPRLALQILTRGCSSVDTKHRLDMFKVLAYKTKKILEDPNEVESVYERAINELEIRSDIIDITKEFIAFELGLNKTEKARKIFKFVSQYANPQEFTNFWSDWTNFETEHGTKASFKEMLRLKRSVAAQFDLTVLHQNNVGAVEENKEATEP